MSTRLMPRARVSIDAAAPRDLRLDFFRGLAMLLIFVSHTRQDRLADWIPARFGFSDAADLFVFVSGYTAGIAYGGIYRRRGWLAGTARVAQRCGQLYLAQLAIVMVVAALAAAASQHFGTDYVAIFRLERLFSDPQDAFPGIVTLGYVPHYLDILPVYIFALALLPLAMALAGIAPWAVPTASCLLWLAAARFGLNIADGVGGDAWYFDPLSWQLYFIAGIGLRMGWLPAPAATRLRFALALAMILAGVVVTRPGWFEPFQPIFRYADKTTLGPLRIVHFAALAYAATYLLRRRLHWLKISAMRPVISIGQHALPAFLAGIVLSDLGGIAFDRFGTGVAAQILVNLTGFAATFAVASVAAWFKSRPWSASTPDKARRVSPGVHSASVP